MASGHVSESFAIGPGDVVAGKYRIDALLGEGGMGAVFKATHVKLGEAFAVKVMHSQLAKSREGSQRFLREAQAAARLRSENAARVFDVDELPTGEPFMVMEHLEGQDLALVLQANKRALPYQEVVYYVRQACFALEEAHQRGLVHRDIKPSNLFLTKRGDGAPCIKVLDFGIAKAAPMPGGERTTLTAPGMMLGTPAYMSPEQIEGQVEVDGRADIWALGASLYELVTGRLPFMDMSLVKLYAAIVNDAPAPPSSMAPVPPELDRVILRCLAKSRDDRFGTAQELSEALRPLGPPGDQRPPDRLRKLRFAALDPTEETTRFFNRDASVSTPAGTPPAMAHSLPPTLAAPPPAELLKTRSHRRMILLGASSGVLAACLAVGISVVAKCSGEAPQPSSPQAASMGAPSASASAAPMASSAKPSTASSPPKGR